MLGGCTLDYNVNSGPFLSFERLRSEMDQDPRKLVVVGGCALDYNVSSGPFKRLLRDF